MQSIVKQDITSLIDGWLDREAKGEHFPVPFDLAWQIAGYSRKDSAKRKLPKSSQGKVYHISVENSSQDGGRPREVITLSCDGLKHLCLMSETEQGEQIRQYFIEAEKRWRTVQNDFPLVAAQVEQTETDKLILLEQLRLKNKEMDDCMIQMHGREVVLALRGCQDQLVTRETVVTEVLELETGKATKFLSAEQLKKAVMDRTGQKLKAASHFVDELRKKGRDDLLTAVNRPVTSLYVKPECLDEAIRVVYERHRQRLIGE